ncbi:hypothetical protein DRN86_00265, partial [Candidatus Geothermarchaeota archaeon]
MRKAFKSFKDFIEICSRIESTSSILKKQEILAGFLKTLSRDEIKPFIMLISGKIFEKEERELGIGYRSVLSVLKRGKIRPLLEEGPISMVDVYKRLVRISEIKGESSIAKKRMMLHGLYNMLSSEEREYLTRIIFGEVRIGASEGLILKSIAEAIKAPLDEVKRAYLMIGDLGETAEIALIGGRNGLKRIKMKVFNPVKPMLATQARDVKEALISAGGRAAVEFKYDGARVQVHVKDEVLRIYSRSLIDLTQSFFDLADELKGKIRAKEAIVDGEVVAFSENGKPLPFQILVRRIKRIRKLPEIAERIPVRIFLFDVLYVDGKTLIDRPYMERIRVLESIANPDILAHRIITSDLKKAEDFYERAIKLGHEGVVVKNLLAPYILGSRERTWLKVKPAETLDLVIVGAEWGHGRRKGWLSDYYLAVYDDERDKLEIVGKTFKGLTDDEFREITRRLLSLKVAEEGNT